jgi:hypothetical protein
MTSKVEGKEEIGSEHDIHGCPNVIQTQPKPLSSQIFKVGTTTDGEEKVSKIGCNK